MIALAEDCMADYDENGWTGSTWLNPDECRQAPHRRRGARGGVGAATLSRCNSHLPAGDAMT